MNHRDDTIESMNHNSENNGTESTNPTRYNCIMYPEGQSSASNVNAYSENMQQTFHNSTSLENPHQMDSTNHGVVNCTQYANPNPNPNPNANQYASPNPYPNPGQNINDFSYNYSGVANSIQYANTSQNDINASSIAFESMPTQAQVFADNVNLPEWSSLITAVVDPEIQKLDSYFGISTASKEPLSPLPPLPSNDPLWWPTITDFDDDSWCSIYQENYNAPNGR